MKIKAECIISAKEIICSQPKFNMSTYTGNVYMNDKNLHCGYERVRIIKSNCPKIYRVTQYLVKSLFEITFWLFISLYIFCNVEYFGGKTILIVSGTFLTQQQFILST